VIRSVPVSPSRRRVLGASLLLVAALSVLLLAGCKGKPTGTVSGKVTYKGQAVTTGSVNFFAPEKGIGADAKLDSSGKFTLSQPLEAGTYKVYVTPPLPEQLPPGSTAKPAPFDVPKKYQDAVTTSVSKEVKPGPNDIPIELD